jgi:hypothetical protein
VIKSIPLGNTHNRVPQVGPNTPGGWMMPTITGVRGQQVIDPYTGAQLTAVSIDADNGGGGSNGIYAGDCGFSRQCPNTLFDAGDGTHGFLCVFWQYQQESGLMYYLPRTPAAGTPRCLGGIYLTSFNGRPTLGALGQNYFYSNSLIPAGYYRAT